MIPVPVGPYIVLLLFNLVALVESVCPHCSGNFASCTWDNNQRCPTVTVVAANAAIVAGGAGALVLAELIPKRFLRVFQRSALETIRSLVRRPQPGTQFELTATTSGPSILSAIQTGQIEVEAAIFRIAELLEEATDETRRSLVSRMETLRTFKGAQISVGKRTAVDCGVYSYLWGKLTQLVIKGEMLTKVALDVPQAGESSTEGSSSFAAVISRPKTETQFFEVMNLFVMFASALGLCSVLIITGFFENVVFDTIRRGESWQLAHELLLVMFRRIEDSGGRLSFANAYNESYLNAVVEEAHVNCQKVYGKCFRTRAGKALETDHSPTFNGKYTKGASPCQAFNSGREHTSKELKPDGTCKFCHVCDHWVSDKGKKGRCLDKNHCRSECTNPNRCDEPIS